MIYYFFFRRNEGHCGETGWFGQLIWKPRSAIFFVILNLIWVLLKKRSYKKWKSKTHENESWAKTNPLKTAFQVFTRATRFTLCTRRTRTRSVYTCAYQTGWESRIDRAHRRAPTDARDGRNGTGDWEKTEKTRVFHFYIKCTMIS